jgi:GNAT superfamily N-acetyltransferase
VGRRYCAVEELAARHRLDGFDCGSAAQNTWLIRHARHAHAAGTSRVYVVARPEDGVVVGYYALATGAVLPADAAPRVAKGAGRHPIPVILLARLAVDRTEQGHGLGRALVKDALLRVDAAADIIGVRALLIHAENDEAGAFYRGLAPFEPSPTDPLHLLLLLKDVRKALA